MNEMVAKYLDALDRTNNNEFAFTVEEQQEFEAFFKEHPELEQMRKELLEQKVPEFRQQIADSYLSDISRYRDIESQLTSLGFNMKSFKDVTLSNGKRMIVFFTNDNPEPTVIEYDPNSNILEDLRQRQIDYKQYQGSDASFNAEEMLKDLAKEQNLYADVRPLEKYEPNSKYFNDKEKMMLISNLLKQAELKNATLSLENKYAYIDEVNNCIIARNGAVLEAKIDTLTQEVVVKSPTSEKEFKNETINGESIETAEANELTGEVEEVQDEDYTEEKVEVEEEEFSKYEIAVEKVLARREIEIDDEKKKEIIDNTQKLDEGTLTLEELPEIEREFYEQCLLESRNLVLSEETVYKEDSMESLDPDSPVETIQDNTYTHKRTLVLKPKKSDLQEAGISSYVYIALVVLVIVFAIFMYIIFRR